MNFERSIFRIDNGVVFFFINNYGGFETGRSLSGYEEYFIYFSIKFFIVALVVSGLILDELSAVRLLCVEELNGPGVGFLYFSIISIIGG